MYAIVKIDLATWGGVGGGIWDGVVENTSV